MYGICGTCGVYKLQIIIYYSVTLLTTEQIS